MHDDNSNHNCTTKLYTHIHTLALIALLIPSIAKLPKSRSEPTPTYSLSKGEKMKQDIPLVTINTVILIFRPGHTPMPFPTPIIRFRFSRPTFPRTFPSPAPPTRCVPAPPLGLCGFVLINSRPWIDQDFIDDFSYSMGAHVD